jgi:hypothetical protein
MSATLSRVLLLAAACLLQACGGGGSEPPPPPPPDPPAASAANQYIATGTNGSRLGEVVVGSDGYILGTAAYSGASERIDFMGPATFTTFGAWTMAGAKTVVTPPGFPVQSTPSTATITGTVVPGTSLTVSIPMPPRPTDLPLPILLTPNPQLLPLPPSVADLAGRYTRVMAVGPNQVTFVDFTIAPSGQVSGYFNCRNFTGTLAIADPGRRVIEGNLVLTAKCDESEYPAPGNYRVVGFMTANAVTKDFNFDYYDDASGVRGWFLANPAP